jgi:uncharacterized protein with TBP-like fold DUF4468
MKRLLLLLALPLFSSGQSSNRSATLPKIAPSNEVAAVNKPFVPMKEGRMFYEAIDSSFKKSKTEVYKSAKLWFTDAFKDSKSVLQMDDKDLGELIGKGTFKYPVTSQGFTAEFWCQFTAKISCRDDKYRIQIYDIMTKGKSAGDYYPAETIINSKESVPQIALREIDSRIKGILTTLQADMRAKPDTF